MELKQIESFRVDHTVLLPGIYVSRIDDVNGNAVTTYDLRMFKPNAGEYFSTGEGHTIEHLGATWLRSNELVRDNVIYFGPMGCRTGFYLVMNGNPDSNLIGVLAKMFDWAARFEGDIPGATEVECGNYRDMDLDGAKRICEEYSEVLAMQANENPDMLY